LTAQLAMRNSIYHLISIRPRDEYHSVPARGLSGQVYKGAVFWDTEMFILPFYLNTDLESARNCVMYRIHTLSGALGKARQYGYDGAFYAWESQETGDDACSDYNVTDAVTGAPIRTYFKEQQIHITGDVAFAALRYFDRTGDFSMLEEGGLGMLLECARFYLSYVRFNRKRDCYVVPRVIGPDEYHEGVDDNAYTNRLIRYTLEGTLAAVARMRAKDNGFVVRLFAATDYASVVRGCRSVLKKLFVPEPDAHGLIEQFAGYFALEDATVEAVKARVSHPNEYLGGPKGVVTPTQVIKQADVITMLALFPNDHLDRVKKANWHYYEPRTEHGSSLSASMYALVASDIGQTEYSYPLFLKSAMIDILGEGKTFAGGIYIGGTHPAASGGAYLTAVYGFSGLKHDADGLRLDARLPKAISGMSFKCRIGAKIANVEVTKTGGSVTWNP
ncbi:MAG: glycoside hydrolase family 65 protein, partial [bacterium]